MSYSIGTTPGRTINSINDDETLSARYIAIASNILKKEGDHIPKKVCI